MIQVAFTLDYEIHGNGDGSPRDLMVGPTDRLLALFDRYGGRLTIMADAAEILKFRQYRDAHGRDDYGYGAIEDQLRGAVARGHDVQLHIHSSYFNATAQGGRWRQDWSEYDFAGLPYDRMDGMIRTCKEFLEDLLRQADPGYRCVAFRAANWSVAPARNIVRALEGNGIRIDTSVFKHGRRAGLVSFDYSGAFSHIHPWTVADDDMCRRDPGGRLWELPIYSELRWIGAFLTPSRIYRCLQARLHPFRAVDAGAAPAGPRGERPGGIARRLSLLTRRHAWKADFNQCTGSQLIDLLKRTADEHRDAADPVTVVMIGHSKLCTPWSARAVEAVLKYLRDNSAAFGSVTLAQVSRSIGCPAAAAPLRAAGAAPGTAGL
jgi:hypothetical protein